MNDGVLPARRNSCKCRCGKRASLEKRRRNLTVYRKVPDRLPDHIRKGRRQSPEHVARRAEAIKRAWDQKRTRSRAEEERNPYSSLSNPREYSAWYHQHHPGYFAGKTKEWIERLPQSRRSALFAQRNKRMRTYVRALSKLRRRLRGLAKGPPSFTSREKVVIDNSAYLSELLRKVKAQYPR